MALMGCVINEKSAIGVARSQRMTPSFGKVSAYEWRASCYDVVIPSAARDLLYWSQSCFLFREGG